MNLLARVLFILAIICLLVATASGRLIVRGLRRHATRSSALLWFDRLVFTSAAIVLLAAAYGRWIEPQWVEVSTISVSTSKLPAGIVPIRIVHLSDFHSPSNMGLQKRLPRLISEQRPDVIVFTGDAVNSPSAAGHVRRTLTELAQIAPTFVIRGNRGQGPMENVDLFGGTGVTELRGGAETLQIRGGLFSIVGASFTRDWLKVRGTLRAQPKRMFVVYLGHSLVQLADVSNWGADLYLAGHTHGGQVALPFYGAIWTASPFGKRYEAGLYREKDMWLYVNRGIGMAASFPKMRFFARPEITVIELRSEAQVGAKFDHDQLPEEGGDAK